MEQRDVDRFWSKVDKSGECWIWNGTVSGTSCVITIGDELHYAHRLSFTLAYGAPPKGVPLRRSCDNRRCVRPEHLFVQRSTTKRTAIPREPRRFVSVPNTEATYFIRNRANGRMYIGQTMRLRTRFKLHVCNLRNNKHHNTSLQNDWNTYGADTFEFGMLEPNHRREKYYIELHHTDDPQLGYNLDTTRPFSERAEQIKALADLWGITSPRYVDEVIRRCIAYTFDHLLEQ